METNSGRQRHPKAQHTVPLTLLARGRSPQQKCDQKKDIQGEKQQPKVIGQCRTKTKQVQEKEGAQQRDIVKALQDTMLRQDMCHLGKVGGGEND